MALLARMANESYSAHLCARNRLLAVSGVLTTDSFVEDSPLLGYVRRELVVLTLMKGDEVVEVLKCLSNKTLLLTAFRHKVVAFGHESPIRTRHLRTR